MKHKIKYLLLSILTLTLATVFSQVGGQATYQFLNLTTSPRGAATGGYFVPVMDQDESQVYANPSLLSKQMDNRLIVNYVNYISDINYGYTGFVKDFGKVGTFTLGLNYLNYGKFTLADEGAQTFGNFTANETALNIGWGYRLREKITVGANAKFISSQLYQYKSFGGALDGAVTYFNPEKDFGLSLVIKNVGTQFTTYTPDNREKLPLDIQLGMAKKLAHAPFRFTVIAHNLQGKKMWFANMEDLKSKSSILNGDEEEIKEDTLAWGQEIMRRIALGLEFLPTQNFAIRVGYNYQRQQEMKLGGQNKMGAVGFSFGAQIKIKKLTFQYTWASYHLAGSSHFISISAKTSDFSKKKEVKAENK
ncbi:MAG: type IX secretion system protein PorQ [Flavobacteriales bacterium]